MTAPLPQRACRFAMFVWATLMLSLATAATHVDLSQYDSAGPVLVSVGDDTLKCSWPTKNGKRGCMELSLDPEKPLIASLSIGANDSETKPILRDVQPVAVLTVGTRDLKPNGWTIFFDNPIKRPYEAFPLVIGREHIKVVTEAGRTSIALTGTSAGPFTGEYRFQFYPGGQLIRAAAVMSTQREASAILIDHGLVSAVDALPSWGAIAWTDLSDQLNRALAHDVARAEARPVQARWRTMIAEGAAGGSVALVPPPHQYFYPLDFVDNFASTWCGNNYRGIVRGHGFGVRQTIEGDRRWVPWMNAPPGSRQDLGVFYLLSDGDASNATSEVLAYTRNDSFKPIAGSTTFSSHYHVEHAIDFLKKQKELKTSAVPPGLQTPAFVRRFKAMGVNAVHLAEFHLSDGDMRIADRLTRLKTLHDECERLSDASFLLLPGEEPNVHLGGHWISFFPKPVMWTLDRARDQPFVESSPEFGKVYHVGNAGDVLKLMESERGLMWTAHPRIKSSTGFPDVYRNSAYFKSSHFLGAAWKAMPADCSLPRLGTRVLDLLDDMNNWSALTGARKQAPGEVDVFAIDERSELYAHMNVNYLRLDHLPRFSDGWQPILDALRGGRFFTTTGEVLINSFSVDDKQSGDTLASPSGASTLRATLEWTFPLRYAEVISGDGTNVHRQRIDLSDTQSFGAKEIVIPVDLRGRAWVRLEVWDVATNGAYTQPVWIQN